MWQNWRGERKANEKVGKMVNGEKVEKGWIMLGSV